MTFTSRHRALAIAVAVGALALPGTAVAKGGTPTPPPPTAPAVQCDYSLDGPTADGGYVFSNQVNEAGCISVLASASTLRLYSLQVTPGWTYEVTSNGEGTNSRVAVQFENPTTGQRAEARIELGKTLIR
jgi:hypothetical protein